MKIEISRLENLKLIKFLIYQNARI